MGAVERLQDAAAYEYPLSNLTREDKGLPDVSVWRRGQRQKRMRCEAGQGSGRFAQQVWRRHHPTRYNVAYKAIAFYINREYNKLIRNGWKDIG